MRKKCSINFRLLKSNHIIVKAEINNNFGNFIIDTGASNSCVDLKYANFFNLNYEPFLENIASATETIRKTYISKNNKINFGKWVIKKFDLVLFDMSYIQELLSENKNIKVVGIIGSDILKKGNSKLNYRKKKITLYF